MGLFIDCSEIRNHNSSLIFKFAYDYIKMDQFVRNNNEMPAQSKALAFNIYYFHV